MVGELITLPLRATGLVARASWRAANLSWEVAGFVVGRVKPGPSHDPDLEPAAATPDHERPRTMTRDHDRDLDQPRTATPDRDAQQSERSFPAAPPIAGRAASPPSGAAGPPLTNAPDSASANKPARPSPQEPQHVSAEPELVDEFAEPGAEDGAGPEIHIREPWEGYRNMTAREVSGRLSNASASELAAVQLYESSTRGRQTILSAVTRQLRSVTGNGSRA